MSIFRAEWVRTDNYGNKVVTVSENGAQKDYIVSAKDKKSGAPFPGFDDIAPGREVIGNAWTSPTNGKNYIFPVDPSKSTSFTPKQGGAVKAAEITGKSVERAQENKDHSIKVSSTFRDATLITLAECGNTPADHTEYETRWKYWRGFLWNHYDVNETDYQPF